MFRSSELFGLLGYLNITIYSPVTYCFYNIPVALIPVKNSVCQLEDLLCRVIGISPEGDDVPVG